MNALKTIGQNVARGAQNSRRNKSTNAKQQFQAAYDAKRAQLERAKLEAQLAAESLDVTLPARGQSLGGLHPVTLTRQRVEELFRSMGFEVADGPEIEDDFTISSL